METDLGSKLEIQQASNLCLVPQNIVKVQIGVDKLGGEVGLASLLDESLDFLQNKTAVDQ
jgi:hypothetical protein